MRRAIALSALMTLAACGEAGTDGGTRAGANTDIAVSTDRTSASQAPADSGAAYPSMEGDPPQSNTTPGAEGGRGSAATGATPGD